jgi:hypothetical protein
MKEEKIDICEAWIAVVSFSPEQLQANKKSICFGITQIKH